MSDMLEEHITNVPGSHTEHDLRESTGAGSDGGPGRGGPREPHCAQPLQKQQDTQRKIATEGLTKLQKKTAEEEECKAKEVILVAKENEAMELEKEICKTREEMDDLTRRKCVTADGRATAASSRLL